MSQQQIKILGIAHQEDLKALKDLLDCPEINCISTIPIDEHLIPNIATLPFDGVVIYTPKLIELDYRFAETLYMARKDITIILIYEEISPEIYENAMHCGITRCLSADMEPDAICKEIVKEVTRSSNRKQQALAKNYESRVIATFSAKGGSGKTTTTVNVATLLASKKKVIVCDLDLQFGDISTYLSLEKDEAMTIAELAEEQNITPNTIKQYIVPTDYNFNAILAPAFPEKALQVDVEKLKTIISMLRADYDYVIIDLSSSIDPSTLTMMETADTIIYVINPEASALNDAKSCLDIFAKLGLRNKLKILVTKEGNSFIKTSDIEDTLHVRLHGAIPNDPESAVDSANLGIPVVLNNVKSKITPAYIEFVENEFEVDLDEFKPKQGLLASLFTKSNKPSKPHEEEI